MNDEQQRGHGVRRTVGSKPCPRLLDQGVLPPCGETDRPGQLAGPQNIQQNDTYAEGSLKRNTGHEENEFGVRVVLAPREPLILEGPG